VVQPGRARRDAAAHRPAVEPVPGRRRNPDAARRNHRRALSHLPLAGFPFSRPRRARRAGAPSLRRRHHFTIPVHPFRAYRHDFGLRENTDRPDAWRGPVAMI
jgi:hypothetical protein